MPAVAHRRGSRKPYRVGEEFNKYFKMKNIIKRLMCVVLLLGATYVYGQKTPYENKVVEIRTKYLTKLGMSATEVQNLKKNEEWLLPLAFERQLKEYTLLHGGASAMALLLDMKKELKQAEKLKTPAELKQEEEIRKAEERKKAEEKALQEERSTDLYSIKQKTKQDFIEWAKRGEFEKKADYEERMLHKEEYLNTMFSKRLQNRIQKKEMGVTLLAYDIDNELYTVESNRGYIHDKFSENRKITATIKVSPEIAKEMATNWNEAIASSNALMVQNGNLFYSKIIFRGVVYDLNPQNQYTDIRKMEISTNELGLSEYFPESKNVKILYGVWGFSENVATFGINCEYIPSDGKLVAPYGVTRIHSACFQDCKSLVSMIVPDGVTTIHEDTFKGCSSLQSITLPNTLKAIKESAFSFCESLTSIIIPNNVTSIGENAFYGCTSLTSITIQATKPPGLTYNSFGANKNIEIYVPAESVEVYKNSAGWEEYSSKIRAN